MGGVFGKSGSFVVDHTLDGVPLQDLDREGGELRHGSIVTLTGGDKPPPYEQDPTRVLETLQERKARRRSHWVAYSTMFVMSIGFSIVLSGVWPYMEKLTPDLGKEYLGWVVAANPFGQMIASPLLGLWGNKAGSIRPACLTTVVFFILGNAMYALLPFFEGWGAYAALIISRFIVGASSANVTLCRSYLASSTTMKERTFGIAIVAAAQALGFVVGPAIQTVLTLVITVDVDYEEADGLVWDKFTAAGWVASIFGFINFIILLPCLFTEYNIADKERAMLKQALDKEDGMKLPKPDYLALSGVLYAFFAVFFIYVLIETLGVPFVMDQYAWDEDEAMVVVGIALAFCGVLSTFIFVGSGMLAKKYDERKIAILLGFVPCVVGTFLFLPLYTSEPIPMQCDNLTETTTMMATTTQSFVQFEENSVTDECDLGCPIEQTWCESVPQLPLPQLVVAFIIVFMGFPAGNSLLQAMFSKMLGPKPQGVWMGVLTGVGSFSRIMGPIFVSYVYTLVGTFVCFGVLTIAMIIALVELIVLYPRIIPMKVPDLKERHAYNGPASEKY